MKTLESLFHYYGTRQASMNEKIYLYFDRADTIDTAERVRDNDIRAAERIAELLEYAELLKDYRKTLFDRAQEIYSASYRLRLEIKRTLQNWRNGKKLYTVTLSKIYDTDGIRPENLIEEKFDGQERHKALKRFQELRKQYPNVEAIQDTDKKHWEQ